MINILNTPKVNKSSTSFQGAYESTLNGLRYLVVSPTVGAMGIDFGTMGIPRPTIEFKNRGADAAIECAVRENSNAINNVFIGFYGAFAAWLLSRTFNKEYNVSAHKMMTNNETIDLFSNKFLEAPNLKSYKRADFVYDILSKLEGYNPLKSTDKSSGFVGLSEEVQKNINTTIEAIFQKQNIDYKPAKKDFEVLKGIIVSDTGAESLYRFGKPNSKFIENSLENFINDTFSLSKAFTSEALLGKLENSSDGLQNGFLKFVEKLKQTKMKSGLLGMAIPIIIGISIMPINVWFTKRRTGKEGFVGVENQKKDTSNGFLAMKVAGALAAIGLSAKTIGNSYSDIAKKLQFTGKLPNLAQFKLVYGCVVASRFLASRDKNELRETAIKDPLGFINWLILGGVVSKITANMLDKDLINYSEKGKGLWSWLTKASVKTYDEVLMPVFKGKLLNSNGEAKSFKTLLSELSNSADVGKITKTKIKNIALAQVAGYLYSAIALGWGITKFNIYITRMFNKDKQPQNEGSVDKNFSKIKEESHSPFNNFVLN